MNVSPIWCFYLLVIPGGSTRVGECVDPGIVDNAVRLPVQGPYQVGDSVSTTLQSGRQRKYDITMSETA